MVVLLWGAEVQAEIEVSVLGGDDILLTLHGDLEGVDVDLLVLCAIILVSGVTKVRLLEVVRVLLVGRRL